VKRVLVPLDGSRVAEGVLPEAMRLAGPGGQIVLIHDIVSVPPIAPGERTREAVALEHSESYLESIASQIRALGFDVTTETFVRTDAADAIDTAARIWGVDVIACRTGARSRLSRLVRPSVAWSALAHGKVPVLLQHIDRDPDELKYPESPAKLLVPLDGSPLAETAIPIARSLARRWGAHMVLIRVIPAIEDPMGRRQPTRWSLQDEQEARRYLAGVAVSLTESTTLVVSSGPVVDTLAACGEAREVTHVVLASHGRTGLARVILGSIADDLVHRLTIPIVVVPALATVKLPLPKAKQARERQPLPAV